MSTTQSQNIKTNFRGRFYLYAVQWYILQHIQDANLWRIESESSVICHKRSEQSYQNLVLNIAHYSLFLKPLTRIQHSLSLHLAALMSRAMKPQLPANSIGEQALTIALCHTSCFAQQREVVVINENPGTTIVFAPDNEQPSKDDVRSALRLVSKSIQALVDIYM